MPGRLRSLRWAAIARSLSQRVWEGGSAWYARMQRGYGGRAISTSWLWSRRRSPPSLRARLDARPLLIEPPNRIVPAATGLPLIAHDHLLAETDPRIEEVDGRRLLARVELERAPRR